MPEKAAEEEFTRDDVVVAKAPALPMGDMMGEEDVFSESGLNESRPFGEQVKSTHISMDNTMIPEELWSRKTSTVMFVGPSASEDVRSDHSIEIDLQSSQDISFDARRYFMRSTSKSISGINEVSSVKVA